MPKGRIFTGSRIRSAVLVGLLCGYAGWGTSAAAQATVPFFDGFESENLAACWSTKITGTNGIIRVATNGVPHNGSRHVVLDSISYATYALDELVLTADLSGQNNVYFDCWVRRYYGGMQAMPAQFSGSTNADGIALSTDGTNWYRLAVITNMPSTSFSNVVVNLDEFAGAHGLSLNGPVKIKFQQYGHYPLILDGLSFDDVQLYSPDRVADLSLVLGAVPALMAVGSNLAYAVTVSNAGPDTAERVVMTNRWSASSVVAAVESSRGTWTTNADTVVFDIGSLAAGETAFTTVTIQPQSTGTLVFVAEASSAILDTDMLNNHQTATTEVAWAGGDLALGACTTSVDEDRGWVDLTMVRTGNLAGVVSVDYETVAGTATAGDDFEPQTGTLFLSNGVAEIHWSIPVVNDEVAEGLETFSVRLGNPGGGAVLVAPSNATFQIRDEDGIAAMPVAETFESGVFSNYWTTYTSLSNRPVIGTNDGPHGGIRHVDMQGDGWSNVLSELTLSVDLQGQPDVHLRFWHKRFHFEAERAMPAVFAGHTNADGVAISVDGTNWYKIHGLEDDDTGEETYRQFDVALEPILAAHGLEFTNHVRIKFQKYGYYVPAQYGRFFDDIALYVPAGNLRFAEPWTWAAGEGDGTITLAVERVDGSVGEVSVQYATYDGTAQAGSDYGATSGTLVFSNGVNQQAVVVPVVQDGDDEDPQEQFTVQLFNPLGGAGLTSPMHAEVAVADDDGIGELEFSAAQFTEAESAATAEIAVLRRYGTAGAGTISWRTQAGTATPGADYVETTGTLTFAAGVTRQVFEIPLLDDSSQEGDETVQILLSSPTGSVSLGTVSTAVLTLRDDEAPRAAFPFYEGFESGTWSNYWTTSSTGAGRIQLANPTNGFEGDRGLVMDSTSGAALNEATLTIDLAGQTNVIFRCWTRDFSDTAHYMPATFRGSTNADGIAVSTDGLVWYRLVDLTTAGHQAVYTNRTVDLAAFAAQHGLPLTATFRIRFQQYDTGTFPVRGRAFDHISLTAPPTGSATTLLAQGFEGRGDDAWGFRLMPMSGQVAVRSERHYTGARSLRLAGSSNQDDGPFVEFENSSFGALDSVFLSVAYSASGPDNSDNLYVHVSYDNGLTWSNAVKLVDGYGDAEVPFGGTSASNPATATGNPWVMALPAGAVQIKVRLVYQEAVGASNTNDFYYIDDVVLSHLPSNQPPVLGELADVTTPVGQPVAFAVTATDVDDDPITLTASNLPAGAVFGATNAAGSFAWESAAPTGIYAVSFQAADKDGTDEKMVTITVYEPPPVLPAPVIQAATDVQDRQFTAHWLASSNATGYRLEVCTNADFPDSGRGSNLMVNAGFETGDATGWDTFETEYTVASNAPQEGAYYATCNATGIRNLMQAIDISGTSTTAYEVSFYYRKTADAGNARIWGTWTAGGQASGDNLHPATYLPVATNWTKMTYYVVPNSGSNTLEFEVRTYTGAAVDWDNFYVGIAGDTNLYVPGYGNRDVSAATDCVVTGLTGSVAYYYRVQATNATQASAYSAVTGVVTEATIPTPPELHPIGDRTVTAGDLLVFSVAATPTDGDVVTLTASNLPGGASLTATNESGYFIWLATAPTGVYAVTFYATDKDGSDTETVDITVQPGPLLPPTIRPATAVQATRFTANWLASSNATGYQLDVGTNATFTGDSGGAAWMTNGYHNGMLGQGTGGTWTETGLTQGSTYLIVQSSDLLITPAMDFSTGQGRTLTFKARTYGGVNATNNTLTVSISTNNGSSWAVLGTRVPTNTTMTAMDAFNLEAYTDAQVRLKWEALGATATVGAGIDDVLIVYRTGVIPAWYVPGYENHDAGNATNCAVTGLTAGVTYFYRARAYNTVSNSADSATTSVTTSVSTGSPPVLVAIGNRTTFLGSELQFQVAATPTESDAVTLTASNLPAGAVFHATNENGTFRWAGAGPTGLYSVIFNAADKDGSQAEAVGITVHPLPEMTGFTLTNGTGAAATFPSVTGRNYRMEFTLDLVTLPVAWTPCDTKAGTGGNLTLQDTNPPVDLFRYYRIVIP